MQFSKAPYYTEQGDFATAGSSNITYATALDRPIVRAEAGGEGCGRVLAAASPRVGDGHLIAAREVAHNNGPWDRPDDHQTVVSVGATVDTHRRGFRSVRWRYFGPRTSSRTIRLGRRRPV